MEFGSNVKVCSNCSNTYTEGDKYCRYCGAPNGTPIYITEMIAEIYGPPFSTVHKCKKCGYSWESTGLGYDKEERCPQCGGEAPPEHLNPWA